MLGPCAIGRPASFVARSSRSLTTFRLSRLECRSNLLRAGDTATLAQFDVFFSEVEISLIDVTASVVELATEIRAKYSLKIPDALHYASAMEAGASVLLSGDRVFARCSDVAVEIL